jgi:hypothetical protein
LSAGKGPLVRLTTASSTLSNLLSDISRERPFIEVFAVLSEKRRQDENENDDERSMVPRASGLFPLALTPTLTLLTAASK